MERAGGTSASLVERLHHHARERPTSLALLSGRYRLTYSALLQGALRIASFLRHNPSSALVAIVAEHDAPAIAAMCGALAAGRAYVPLDPAWPTPRLASILADAQVKTVLADAASLALARAAAGTNAAMSITCIEDLLERPDEGNLAKVAGDELACVLYTSGSTGQPKGVMHRQSSLVASGLGFANAARISADDRMTLLAPVAYAASHTQVFAALVTGATLVAFDVRRQGLTALHEWIAEHGVTVFHSVPALLRELVATLRDRASLSSLRLIRLGGDAAVPSDLDILELLPQGCQLMTGYAATEHLLAMYSLIGRHTPLERGLKGIPLRTCLPGVDVCLVDDHDRPIKSGQSGELLVKSDSLAIGYWRQPSLTAERFVADPRSGRGRVYRTRDLARFLPDGGLLHEGRKDDMVKIRGVRIDPAEVAAALSKHPHVADAAVLASSDDEIEPALVGYVVARDGRTLAIGELHRFASGQLASAMVPTRYALVDSLPRTSLGKLDRLALARVPASRPSGMESSRMPTTPTELKLAQLWCDTLGVDSASLEDDFFGRGGHSLHAMHLFAEIEASFGVRLPLTQLFPDATLGALSAAVEQANRPPADILVPIQPRGTLPPLFCVHPLDGDVIRYHALARGLAEAQPFYGLRAPGLIDPAARFRDVGELAATYVERLETEFSGSPYYLAGFSLGGVLAVEMARQLLARGQRVAFVGLLDTPAPNRRRITPLGMLRRDVVAYARFKARRMQTEGLRGALGEPDLLDTIGAFSAEHLAVAREHRRLWRNFCPRPYPGRVVLFRAAVRPLIGSHDRTLGWERVARGGVEVRVVPGLHQEILEPPYLDVLVRKLGDVLADARARADG